MPLSETQGFTTATLDRHYLTAQAGSELNRVANLKERVAKIDQV